MRKTRTSKSLSASTDDGASRDPVAHLHALFDAHWHARVLFTAAEIGLFEFTQTPRTPGEVAQAGLCHARAARPLLDALLGARLLEQRDGRYVNGPGAACLVPSHPSGMHHFVQHMARACDRWDLLGECLKSGRPAVDGRHASGSAEQTEYALAMESVARRNTGEILAAVDFSPFRHLLDLGGGSGAHAIAFLEACPELRVTLYEAPGTADLARERIHAAHLGHRCDVRAGDFLRDPLGGGYDAVWLSNVLHAYGPEMNQALLGRCFDALAPGGALFVRDFLLDECGTSPAFNAVFGLHMLVHTQAGRTYRLSQLAELAQSAGFEHGNLVGATAKARIWTARKGVGP